MNKNGPVRIQHPLTTHGNKQCAMEQKIIGITSTDKETAEWTQEQNKVTYILVDIQT